MQPYVNPYYFNQYQNQNYQQPQYQQSFQQYQQPVQQPQGINGRVVGDFSEITANEIPMDGSKAIFMKKDGSEIVSRSWNANGQIVSTSYKPILDDLESNVDNLPFDAEKLKFGILDELTGVLDERFAKLEKLIKPARAKKEVAADE